jgi:hypothetical protein
MDIMGIERVKNEDQYRQVIDYIGKLAETEPAADSEIADIIYHLGTLANDWAAENLKPKQNEDVLLLTNGIRKTKIPQVPVDKPTKFAILITSIRDIINGRQASVSN